MSLTDARFAVTKETLLDAIRKVGIASGATVYVASSLAALSMMENPVDGVLWALREAVGPDGTLVLPTFNFSFCEGTPFDVENTPSTTGVLTEAARKLPGALRTWAPPFHSVVAIGKKAPEIAACKSLSSFGANSVFQYLFEQNAKQLLLGTSYHDGVVHFHWLEERHAVPYRYWKKFEGEIIRDGRREQRIFFMYARREGAVLDFQPAAREFELHGKTLVQKTGLCTLRAFSLADFTAFFDPVFKRNPLVLLKDICLVSDEPSPVKRIDHIAVVSKYSGKIRRFFQDAGLSLAFEGIVPEIAVNCQYYAGLNAYLEIVEPTAEESCVGTHHKKNAATPIHHIALEVDDLDRAVEYFARKGYKPIDGQQYLSPIPRQRVVFLSPMYTGGMLVELVANDAAGHIKYEGIAE
jgi:aminoglycoside 3-N-acetyltransferase